jgi:Fe2+ or Zn2+ uptake regulation protein
MNYAEYFTGHVRLTILKILLEAPAYSANDSIIHMAVESMGLAATRDRIRTELVWLEEQGLLKRTQPHPDVTVGCITQRGQDVANGMAQCPGVQRPSPKG